MRIKFIAQEGLDAAKGNYPSINKEIIQKGKTDLAGLFNDPGIIKESSIEVEDFSFDMSEQNPAASDAENVRRVYGHMKGLSESQASDERIWSAFTLSAGLDYMRYRWMPEDETDKYERFFCKNANKRSLFRNGVARLWWIGYHTYDAKRADPFELTDFICKDQDYINNLLDIGFASNPTISKAVVGALMDAEKSGKKINRELVRTISRYVNLLGGVYLIDLFSYDEMYAKIKAKIDS